ncbi:hypothetical protein ACH35V_28700 [Actinomadura sp. 1N219]|uniref:hypothetical protein n=1 Tax=Actinomadura sp. 1N219 TaxID=3375152 RepID=UPI0037B9B365
MHRLDVPAARPSGHAVRCPGALAIVLLGVTVRYPEADGAALEGVSLRVGPGWIARRQ